MFRDTTAVRYEKCTKTHKVLCEQNVARVNDKHGEHAVTTRL